MVQIIKALFIMIASIAIAGCGDEFKSFSIADEIIKSQLKSPSTYKRVSQKLLWKGVTIKGGNNAYIIKTEYDAQNGFGATVRGCSYTSFSIIKDSYYGSSMWAKRECADEVGNFGYVSSTEEQFVRLLIEVNGFADKNAVSTAEKVQPAPTHAVTVAPRPEPAQPPRNFQAEANKDLHFVNPTTQLVGKIDLTSIVKHPFSVVKSTQLEQKFRLLMGNDFEEFLDDISVSDDNNVKGDKEWFGSGMAQHSGGRQAGAFFIDQTGHLFAVMVDEDQPNQKFRIYGASNYEQLPERLRAFISEDR